MGAGVVRKSCIHKRELEWDLEKSIILAKQSKASCFLSASSAVSGRCKKHSFFTKGVWDKREKLQIQYTQLLLPENNLLLLLSTHHYRCLYIANFCWRLRPCRRTRCWADCHLWEPSGPTARTPHGLIFRQGTQS